MRDDHIQGILFDAPHVIRFRDPLTPTEKAIVKLRQIGKTPHALKKNSTPAKPTFATNLLPPSRRTIVVPAGPKVQI